MPSKRSSPRSPLDEGERDLLAVEVALVVEDVRLDQHTPRPVWKVGRSPIETAAARP